MERYSRQILLPQIGPEGQARLRGARVLLVGVGALGSAIAELMTRAGIGFLRIADRDIVERSNLQRQMLFDESDARDGVPKAVAAARRLAAINSDVRIDPQPVDVATDNIVSVAEDVDLILDGTDNAATRYLVNDAAVKLGKPWVYGACVGVEGRMMALTAAQGPCLRCVFPDPPAPGELPTCDTVGVLGPVAAIVGACQAIAALRLIASGAEAAGRLLVIDGWNFSVRTVDLSSARDPQCPCCGLMRFEFLDAPTQTGAVLCGRQAVQIRPARAVRLDLDRLSRRMQQAGVEHRRTTVFARIQVPGETGLSLTAFADGRAIVQGTSDLTRARSLYDRFIGG